MKRNLSIAMVGLVLLSGCIKFDYALTLRSDGSGIMEFSYAISENSLTQFKAMMKLRDNLTILSGEQIVPFEKTILNNIFLSPSEEQAKKELGKYAEFGISAETIKIQSVQGQRQAYFVLAFENLAKLAETEPFGEYGFNLKRDKNGDYFLSRPPERVLAGEESSPAPLSDEEQKTLMPFLNGFHVGIRVNVPSRIISSTAHRKTSETSAIWNFDFDSNPNVLIALQNQKFEVTFDGSDRRIKIPPVRMRVGQSKTAN